MRFERHTPKRGRVEIIPMIDTILILLIFYMSFSTFSAREKRLDAQMSEYPPNRVTERRDIPPPEITVHVRSKDAFVVNGVTYKPATLRDSLATLSAVAPETRVIIEADPETSYQAVINAADVCAQAKLHRLLFRPVPS
jgi:biopolymer transport protein ExbD